METPRRTRSFHLTPYRVFTLLLATRTFLATPAPAQVSVTYTPTFTATGLSMWGPGVTSGGGSTFYGYEWNDVDFSIGGIEETAIGDFGARVYGSTSGKIGLDVALATTQGHVDINLPYSVTISSATNLSNAGTHTLNIAHTLTSPGPNGFVKTTFAGVDLDVGLRVQAEATLGGEIAFFDRAGGSAKVLDLDISAPLFSYNGSTIGLFGRDFDISTGLSLPLPPPLTVDGLPKLTSLGSLTVAPPQMNANSGTGLTAHAADIDMVSLDADLVGLAMAALGMPFNLLDPSVNVGGVGFTGTLLHTTVGLDLGLDQDISVTPTLGVILRSSTPLTYNTPGGPVTTSALVVTNLSLPISFTKGAGDVAIFPEFFLTTTLRNDLDLTLSGAFALEAIHYGFNIPGLISGSVGPLVDIDVNTPTLDIGLFDNSYEVTGTSLNISQLGRSLTNVAPTVGNIGSNQAVNIPGLVGNFATSTIGGSLRLSNGSLYLNDRQLTVAAGGAIVLTSGSGPTANRLSTPSLSNLGTLEVGTGSLVEVTGANGLLNVNGSGVHSGGNLRVFGTLTYHGPSITSNQGTLNVSGSILNTTGGVQGNALRTLTSNSGTLTLGAQLNTGLGFTNSGTMTVNADITTATLSNSGTYIIDSGSHTLSTPNGLQSVNGSGVLTGGTYYLKGAIYYRGAEDTTFPVLPGDTPVYYPGTPIVTNNANLTLAGSSGDPRISNQQDDGGFPGDALATLSTNNGTLVINTGYDQKLSGGLTNNGTLGIFDTGSSLEVGGNFTNASGKTVTVSAGKLDLERASGDGNFTNLGTLNILNNGRLEVDGSLGNFSNVNLGNRTGTLTGGTWNLSGQVAYGTGTTTVPNIHRIGAGTTLNLVGGSFYNQFFNEDALSYLTQNAGILNLNGVTVRSHYSLSNSGTILVTMPSGILGFRDSLANTGTISIGAGSKLSTLGSATWADSANWANIDSNGSLFGIGNLILAGIMEYKGPAITQLAANNFLTLSGDSWRFRRLTASSTEVNGFALNTINGGLNLTNRAKWEMPVGGNLLVSSTGLLATSPTSVLVVQAGQLQPQYNANVTNNGAILLKHIDSSAATLVAGGDFSLMGTGSLQMTNHVNNGIFGNATVFNESTHTIAGAGQIRSGLYNRGAIESIGTAGLVINAANGTTITNIGVIRAGGHYTYPLVNGQPDHSNPTFVPGPLTISDQTLANASSGTDGLISSGGSLRIATSTVTGGRVEVRPGALLTLDSTTLSGVTFDAQPLSRTEIYGGVTKLSGTIGTTAGSRLTLLDIGNASDPAILEILSGQTFNHYGDLALQANSRIEGAGTFVNHNLARMHSPGVAVLLGNFQNASDGEIDIDYGGALRWSGSITNAGLVRVGTVGSTGGISGSLSFPATAALGGGGTVQLGGAIDTDPGAGVTYAWVPAGRLTAPDGLTPTLTNTDNTIRGAGVIGDTRLGFVNASGGTVHANGSGSSILINAGPSGFSNSGLLKVDAGAQLTISTAYGGFSNLSGGTLTGGRYEVAGTLVLPGAVTTNAADLTLLGSGQFLNAATSENALGGLAANAAGSVLRLQGGAIQNTSVSLANAGSIVVGGTGGAAGGNLTVGSLTGGGTVHLADAGAVLRFDTTGGTSTGANVVSGAGQLHKLGGGTLTLSATNTYTGNTTLAVGTLVAAADNALGTGTLTLTGGTLRGDGTARSLANAISLRGNATIGGSSDLSIGGIVTPDTGSRTLTISNTGTTTLAGVVVDPTSLWNALTLNVGGNTVLGSVSSGTAGTGILNKVGNGTLTITGPSTVGATGVHGGTLVLAHDSALGSGLLALSNNATVRTDGAVRTFSSIVNLSGHGTVGGTANLSFGQLRLINPGDRTLSVSNTGLTTFDGVEFTDTVARTLTVDNSGAVTISGAVTNGTAGGALVKTGTGTLTLSGANTFSDGFTLAAGTLAIAHNQAFGTGTLTLAGGTFGAGVSGLHVANPTTLAGDTTFASAQLLDLDGALTLAGSHTLTSTSAVLRLHDVALSDSSTARTLTFDGAGSTFVVGSMTNGAASSGSIVKNGPGTLVLSGPNSFSGGTTLNAGTVYLNHNSALGSGSLTINGGVLTANPGTFTLANAVALNGDLLALPGGTINLNGLTTLGGNRLITVTTGTLGLGGGLADGGNAFTLTKAGAGTLSLGGNSTFTGGTTINAGTLISGSAGALGSGPVTLNGGSLTIGASQSLGAIGGVGVVTLGTGTTLTLQPSGATTFSGALTGAGALAKTGGGTLTLANGNSHSGGTTLAGGTTVINHPGALGTGTLVFSGGALASGTVNPGIPNAVLFSANPVFTGANPFALIGAVTLPGTRTLTVDPSATVNVGGAIAQSGGVHGVVKAGNGTLGLFGANTYTGPTSVAGGTMVLGRVGGSSLAGALAVQAGATARIDQANQVADTANISVSGTLQLNATEGIGTGGLSLQGGTVSGAGALQFNSNIGLSTLASATTATISAPVSLLAGSHVFNVADGAAAADLTIGGSISQTGGAASFSKQGAGLLALTNANSHTGGTFVEGGTLAVGHGSALGGGMLVVANSTLRADVDFPFSNTVQVVGAANFNTNGRNLGLIGQVTNTGTLIKSGTGTLILANANNNYSGGTVLQGGTLAVDHNNALGTGTLTLQGGLLQSTTAGRTVANALSLEGNFDIGNTPGMTFSGAATLTGSRTVTVGSGSAATFAGTIGQSTAGLGLTKAGAGTLTLAAANTYTGTTTVSAGTLVLNPGSGIRALTIGNGALVRVLGSNPVDNASVVTINGGTYQIENGAFDHQQGALNMTGGQITTTGNGILILDGLLTTNATNTTATATGIRLAPNAGFLINAGPSPGGVDFAVTSIGEQIAGMDLLKGGSGLMRMGGSSSYTGGTNVVGGHLSLANSHALPDVGLVTLGNGTTLRMNNLSDAIGGLTGGGQVQLGSGGALDIGGGNATSSFSGTFTGGGTVRKIGTGTLTLTGASTFSGSTAVNAGTLRLTNATGSALGTSNLTVAAAGILAGDGAFTGNLSLAGTVSPGTSPGLLESGATTFLGGGTYLWEINNAAGSAGTGWDLLSITGTLTIAATSANPFTIDLVSLAGAVAGPAANFNATQGHTFLIASATGGITGFDASDFTLDLTGFGNPLAGGSWAIAQSGNNLNLVFSAAAVPEPSTYAMIVGAAALAFAAWRRRARRT